MRFRESKSDDERVQSAGLLLTKRSVFLCDPCKAVLNGSGKELQMGVGSWELGSCSSHHGRRTASDWVRTYSEVDYKERWQDKLLAQIWR